jgi:hypothetical protein
MHKSREIEDRCSSWVGLSLKEDGVVTLQPLAMRVFIPHGIYSPSQIRPNIRISYHDFLKRFADHSTLIRVCFDEEPMEDTIWENSQPVTAYGYGIDGWYLVVE